MQNSVVISFGVAVLMLFVNAVAMMPVVHVVNVAIVVNDKITLV